MCMSCYKVIKTEINLGKVDSIMIQYCEYDVCIIMSIHKHILCVTYSEY